MDTLFMIGNTHFDPVWLWTWDEAMASIRATFRAALDRMKEDPDFIYSFSTPAVFEWIEQVDPELFEEIQTRVREGRWDVEAEGWWLQPDCNIPSGESLIRQELYGQRYLMEHFGKHANTMFNIDSFGHSAMLPQILRKGDIRYYIFTRPTKHEMDLEDDLFEWRSPDGSSVLAARSGSTGAAGNYPQDLTQTINEWRKNLPAMSHDAFQVYGVTDHGGAPTKQAIKDIHAAQEANDAVAVRFASTGDFFRAQEGRVNSIVRTELPTLDYGPDVNSTEVKRNNRKGEYAILFAERASWMANKLFGRAYPKEKLRGAWKDLMFNQFHDIMGGCLIPEAFTDVRNLHGRLLHTAHEITHFAIQSMCRRIQTFGDNKQSVWNICLFNLNGTPYHGMVESEVQWAWEFPWYSGGIELVDETGKVYPAQIITEKSAIPGFRTRFAFVADVPAMGWKTYAVRKTDALVERDWSETGIQSPFKFRVYEDKGDTWSFNAEDGYGAACEVPELVERRTVEKGDLLMTVRQIWRFRDSKLEEYITSYKDNPRLDYRYVVHWNEQHKVLKLIPANGNAQSVTTGIPAGAITRSADKREYPLGEWIKWRTDGGAVTLLLDGISAYDTDGSIRLSVLRSPLYGDLRIGELNENEVRPFMEQGVHEGRIAWIPREMSNGEAAAAASHWIAPPVAVCEANHVGSFPPVHSMMELSGHAVLTALKQSEDGNDTVLRFVEMDGCAETLQADLNGQMQRIPIEPYEIKTIRVKADGAWENVNLLEESGQ